MVQSVRKVPPHSCKRAASVEKEWQWKTHPFEDIQYLLQKKDNFHYTMLVFGVVVLGEIHKPGMYKTPCKWDEGMNCQVVSRTSSNPQGFSLQNLSTHFNSSSKSYPLASAHWSHTGRQPTFHLLIQHGFTNHIAVGLPNTFFYSKGFIIIRNWTTTF